MKGKPKPKKDKAMTSDYGVAALCFVCAFIGGGSRRKPRPKPSKGQQHE